MFDQKTFTKFIFYTAVRYSSLHACAMNTCHASILSPCCPVPSHPILSIPSCPVLSCPVPSHSVLSHPRVVLPLLCHALLQSPTCAHACSASRAMKENKNEHAMHPFRPIPFCPVPSPCCPVPFHSIPMLCQFCFSQTLCKKMPLSLLWSFRTVTRVGIGETVSKKHVISFSPMTSVLFEYGVCVLVDVDLLSIWSKSVLVVVVVVVLFLLYGPLAVEA